MKHDLITIKVDDNVPDMGKWAYKIAYPNLYLTDKDLKEAQEDIQEDIKEEVRQKFEKLVEIEIDEDEEGNAYNTIDPDRFLDSLFEDYRLENR
jgi:hypothetical protein